MAARGKPNVNQNWPCIFRTKFIRTEINPRVQAAWRARTGRDAPFGALQQLWRQQHCRTLNRWTSDDCPYGEEDCAVAYWASVQHALEDSARSPRGWFFAHAKVSALIRQDNKPLARDRQDSLELRTNGQEGPGHTGDAAQGPVSRQGLRGPATRPQRIGSLLGSFDLGPRQGPAKDGEESSK